MPYLFARKLALTVSDQPYQLLTPAYPSYSTTPYPTNGVGPYDVQNARNDANELADSAKAAIPALLAKMTFHNCKNCKKSYLQVCALCQCGWSWLLHPHAQE